MPEVIVDPRTGNVFVVHRRSIGIGTILFFTALVLFIAANYVSAASVADSLYSIGALCISLLLLVLLWRCCQCCCCSPAVQSAGYVVVDSNRTAANAAESATTQLQTQAVPAFPANLHPVAPAYAPQPGFNPNFNAGMPATDVPPSYADATTQNKMIYYNQKQ